MPTVFEKGCRVKMSKALPSRSAAFCVTAPAF
jgi:hypothetical protein